MKPPPFASESGAAVFDVVEPDEISFLTRCQRRTRSGTLQDKSFHIQLIDTARREVKL